MGTGNILPFSCSGTPAKIAAKACSGKCAGVCGMGQRVWVIAASEGLISLFEKEDDGHLSILPQGEGIIAPSAEEFRTTLEKAVNGHEVDQLVIVGSSNDVAWVEMMLPERILKHVVAEIRYPLMVGWFKEMPLLPALTHALEHVFKS